MSETTSNNPEKVTDKNWEVIPVVDENDRIIGYKRRGEIEHADIYRVVSLWVINSDGQVLLAQRHHDKSHDPLKWGPAVSGTITQEDESYESAGAKEGLEEIGLNILADDVVTELMEKDLQIGDEYKHQFISQPILVRVPANLFPLERFVAQEEEVEQLVWIDLEELLQDVAANPDKYVPSFPRSLAALIDFIRRGEKP